jgi:16S rRNA (cytosine1407-C5)-methyltransferase
VNTLLPKQFLKNLQQIFSDDQISQILAAFDSQRPTTFRTNTLKISTTDLIKKLTEEQIDFQQFGSNPDWFILKSDKKKFTQSAVYTNGLIYIQSLASLLPAIVLDPQSDETVLDMTAAPGSKTTQIAALMKNQGKIIANDRHLIRLEKLNYNLKKQGVENTQVTNLLGQEIGSKHPNFFDKTLLDAPCSLEGTFNTAYPKSFSNWNQELVDALSQRQKDLIYSAYLATKPGGAIVYSTCTLEVNENEAVVDWLINKTNQQVIIEKIDLPQDIPIITGITSYLNKSFDQSLCKTIRILPSPLFEGFYLAKLKKIA